jgi:hypothetical protein
VAADLGAIADRLFDQFMAPLVLGGALAPGRPIGARGALAIGGDGEELRMEADGKASVRVVADADRLAHVQLGRVRVARRIVAVDRFVGPTAEEWALSAALHDLVQAAHPKLGGALRRSAPSRLLALVEMTLDRVPPPDTAAEALARHTWFSRALEITRTDTVVSWWVGRATYLGEVAPKRLEAWPELRRVHVEKNERALVDLPSAGARVDATHFAKTLAHWLSRTPLTDLATCARAHPMFEWTRESLALVGTPAGRTLALRAMALAADATAVDRALGHATKRLLAARAWKQASVAIDLLAERALADAQSPARTTAREPNADVTFARGAGALAASRALDAAHLPESERTRIRAALEQARAAAGDVDALLGPLVQG